jgi:transposase-like protein
VADQSVRYPQELRERAVPLVAKSRPDHASDWQAMRSVAAKLGIGSTETVRKWVRKAEVDAGTRPGVTSEESADLRRRPRVPDHSKSECAHRHSIRRHHGPAARYRPIPAPTAAASAGSMRRRGHV